jgi:glycosyltransferase involved in cell wall biosynthesis
MNHPKITILMPVYNAKKYLKESIQSILDQSFVDFEFLIFNDGSTDESGAIVRQFPDPRIQLFDSPENRGYVYHLNQGICIAHGSYIARMDADDISHSERLAKQVTFMDDNPEVGVCGTWYDTIGDGIVVQLMKNDQDLRLSSLSGSPFSHPSVMMRTDLLRKHNLFYDASLVPAEDYYFWTMIARYAKLANLPEVLLHYRVHEGQISYRKNQLQRDTAQYTRDSLVEFFLGRPLSGEEKFCNLCLFDPPDDNRLSSNLLSRTEFWVNYLLQANRQSNTYNQSDFSALLQRKLDKLRKLYYLKRFMVAPFYNLDLLIEYFTAKPLPFHYFGKKATLSFMIKCFICWRNQANIPPFSV